MSARYTYLTCLFSMEKYHRELTQAAGWRTVCSVDSQFRGSSGDTSLYHLVSACRSTFIEFYDVAR